MKTLFPFFLFFFFFGCVERRIDISSIPSDAEVYLDGRYVGKTPLSISFDFYGTREVQLKKKLITQSKEEVSKEIEKQFFNPPSNDDPASSKDPKKKIDVLKLDFDKTSEKNSSAENSSKKIDVREIDFEKQTTSKKSSSSSSISLSQESYLSYKTFISLRPPLYETFPFDFFTENVIPYQWSDIHSFEFQLTKMADFNEDEKQALRERATEFKTKIDSYKD